MNPRLLPRLRRNRVWFGVVAAALFGLRALIPTGYMFAPVEGHARLVMCPAGIHHAMGMGAMAGMEHQVPIGHAGHPSPAAEQCPFALAGGAGLLAAVSGPVEPYFSLLRTARAVSIDSVSAAPPYRYHAPRGPPSPA